MYTYIPSGVCSRRITIELDKDTIKQVNFIGGCEGNLTGISRLVKDRPIDEVISLLQGARCGQKNTSCPDQLACALKEAREQA